MSNPYVLILGITQDGGYPQANCYKKCCEKEPPDGGNKPNWCPKPEESGEASGVMPTHDYRGSSYVEQDEE